MVFCCLILIRNIPWFRAIYGYYWGHVTAANPSHFGWGQIPGDSKHIEIAKALQCLNSSNLYIMGIFSKPFRSADQDDIPRTTGQRLIGLNNSGAQHVFPESLERWNTVSIFHSNILGVNDTSAAQSGPSSKPSFVLNSVPSVQFLICLSMFYIYIFHHCYVSVRN